MTRQLRDAFPSGLHRDAFQLDNMHAAGFGLKSRRVYAGQLRTTFKSHAQDAGTERASAASQFW
jgi:hypothetical protein